MTIVPKQTVVAAVTGIALAFTPSPSPVAAQDPVQLKKDLDDANKKLADAEKEIKRLRALLEGKKDETGTVLPSDPGAIEEIKRLKNQVAALEKKVDEMQKSTSFRMGQAVPTTGKGTVRVVNEYPVVVTIVVNDKSYRVEPNTALNIDVPVGDFSYQLLQTGAGATPTKSTIKEKEVVTLRIK